MSILNNFKHLLTYRKKDPEGFELLEDYERKTEIVAPEKRPSRTRTKKKPIPISKWSEKKKIDKIMQEDSSLATVCTSLEANLAWLRQFLYMEVNNDIQIREFKINNRVKAFLLYLEGMVDQNTLNNYVLRQLMLSDSFTNYSGNYFIDYLVDEVLSVNQVCKEQTFDKIVAQVFNGVTALFVDGFCDAILIESRGYESRAIEKPATETVIHGSHESFVENLRTNITLVRKIIRNKRLVTEIIPLGETDNSNCAILYMEGITNPAIIKEVRRRLSKLNIDFVLGDGMLSQLIEDHPFALVPQILSTERPDRVASFLLEGKVAIFSEGAPFATIVPATFYNLLHTSEDNLLRWPYGTFLRIIRIIGMLIASLLPGIYTALILYHHEMIPTDLLFAITSARELVPFPTFFEIILMEVSFELIREAGIRVPGVIGQTLGIIGALILGQAAVAANLVSPILIIIIAATGLGSFSVPNYSLAFAIRIVRFFHIITGAIAGFYGIAISSVILIGLGCHMKSFGVPFMTPIAPKTHGNPDLVYTAPAWMQTARPDSLNPQDSKTTGENPRGWTDE